MAKNPLPSSVAIIGAGASALFAARQLRRLGVQEITLLEKENQVGGKCSTYKDPQNPDIQAERGAAVVAPNYGEVFDALKEKGIVTERVLPAYSDTVEIITKYQKSDCSRVKVLLQLAREIYIFNKLVSLYRKCCTGRHPLPPELEASFGRCAESHGLRHLHLLLKPFITGFGYGDMYDCPTYSVLEYMGYTTIPCLIAQYFAFECCELRSIQGGFQHLMQKIAEDFHVLLGTTITQVVRKRSHTTLHYTTEGKEASLNVEALILAVSPKHWQNILGPQNLTPIEKTCSSHLTYYRYPVVICRLLGLPAHQIYRPEALQKEKFGHVAFVSTVDKRENPKEGRLCSAYINLLPQHSQTAHLAGAEPQREHILADLRSLPGVIDAEIMEYKVWEDYFSSLPWALRLALENQQYTPATKTLYVGSYTLGSFEDVACVANQAAQLVNTTFDANG